MVPNLESKNYYELLGVPKSADDATIKKAYRKLAVKYHPDKNKDENATAKFQKISAAFATLSDESKRKEYDIFGTDAPGRGGADAGAGFPGGKGFSGRGMGGQSMSQEQAEQIFSMFFGGTGGDPSGGTGGIGGVGGRPGGGSFEFSSTGGGMPGGFFMGSMEGGGGGDPFGGGGIGSMFSGMGGGDPFMSMGGHPGMTRGSHSRGSFQGNPRAAKRQNTNSPALFGTIKNGSRVTLRGLSKVSMNGLAGVIVGWDSRSNRQVVDLGRAGEDPVAVKRGNIQQHPDVKVVGTSQGEINNTRGQLVGYVPSTERYNVKLRGKTVALKTANVVIPKGAVVCLAGLNSKEFNGRWGTVEEMERGKYIVRTKERRMKIGLENVVC